MIQSEQERRKDTKFEPMRSSTVVHIIDPFIPMVLDSALKITTTLIERLKNEA